MGWYDLVSSFFATFRFSEVVMLCGLMLSIYVVFRSQKRADFDWAQFLIGPDGKPSSSKLAMLLSMLSSTVWMTYLVINSTHKHEELDILFKWFGVYLLTWSSSKLLERGMDFLILKYTGGRHRRKDDGGS